MDLARTSRYWTSYRASKTFRLTINIYEAHLGFSSSSAHGSSHGDTSGLKVIARVRLPNDPTGEHHETRQSRAPNPVWDQAIVLNDVAYSESVRVEVLGSRKIGENPVLASKQFEVHDVMGLSLRDEASLFQLECDRSRARFGVILMSFRFDPPVAADVVGDLDVSPCMGSSTVPKPVAPLSADSEGRDLEEREAVALACGREQSRPGPEVEDPVYMNVAGNFACLLLDDDVLKPVDFAKVEPRESSKPLVVSPSRRDPNDPADAEGLRSAHRDPKHSRRPRKTQDRGTREAHTNGSGASPSNLSDSAHERVAAAHNAGGVSTSGSGGSNNNSRSNSRSNSSSSNINGVASREPRPHAGSFGGLAQQLTTLGRGGGGGFGKGTPPLGNRPRPSSTAVSVERTPPADPSKQLEEMPQQRWGMGRLRQKQEWRSVGGSVAGGSGSRDGRKSIQETRATWPEGWKDGFRRSSGLSGLRPRTVTVPGSSGRSWGRSSVLLGCDTGGDGAVGAMNDADGAEATFLGPSGNLRPAFASDEEGDGAFMTIDPRYNVEASFWQP
ncbi:unnamed protein product [Ascophyllum nodosum]